MNIRLARFVAAVGCVGICAVLLGCVSDGKPGKAAGGLSAQQLDRSARATARPEAEPRILPRTHYAAGRLLERRGDFYGAIAQYRRAVALNHRYVEALNRLGVTLDRVGHFEEADRAFTEAIYIEPGAAYLRNNLAFSYMLQRRWSDAEAELRNALLLDPEFTRARVNLALVLAHERRFDDALAAFSLALPEADAHYNMGLLYRAQGRYADAARSFRMALNIDPRFEAAGEQIAGIQDKIRLIEWPTPSPADGTGEQSDDTEPVADEAPISQQPPGTETTVVSEAVEPPPAEPPPSEQTAGPEPAAGELMVAEAPAAPAETAQPASAEAPTVEAAVDGPSEPLLPASPVQQTAESFEWPGAPRPEAPQATGPVSPEPEPIALSAEQLSDALDLWYPAPVPLPVPGEELPGATTEPEGVAAPEPPPADEEQDEFDRPFAPTDAVTERSAEPTEGIEDILGKTDIDSPEPAPLPGRIEVRLDSITGESPFARPETNALDVALPLDAATMPRPSLFSGAAYVGELQAAPGVRVQTIAVRGDEPPALLLLRQLIDKARRVARQMRDGLVDELLRLSGPDEERTAGLSTGEPALSYGRPVPLDD